MGACEKYKWVRRIHRTLKDLSEGERISDILRTNYPMFKLVNHTHIIAV